MSKGLKIVLISVFIFLLISFAGLIFYHSLVQAANEPVKTSISGLNESYDKVSISDSLSPEVSVSPAYGRDVTVYVKDGKKFKKLDSFNLENKEKDKVKLNLSNDWKSHKTTEYKVVFGKLKGEYHIFKKPHVIHTSKAREVTFSVNTKKVISSKTCAVLDADTGEVVYEWDGYKKHRPASMTKMMTAVLFCEYTDAQDKVVVSSRASQTEWSGLLNEGDEITRDDLLSCMMLSSANDAAEAAGDYVQEKTSMDFKQMMNEKAKSLNMNQTTYLNCCGLDLDDNYSCAVDQARIGAFLMTDTSDDDFNTLREIVKTKEAQVSIIRDKDKPAGDDVDEEKIEGGKKKLTFKVGNTNHLLDDGFDGVKTGFTDMAGPCFCGSFTSNGKRYVTVVMGGKLMDDRFSDTKKLKKLVDSGVFNSEE